MTHPHTCIHTSTTGRLSHEPHADTSSQQAGYDRHEILHTSAHQTGYGRHEIRTSTPRAGYGRHEQRQSTKPAQAPHTQRAPFETRQHNNQTSQNNNRQAMTAMNMDRTSRGGNRTVLKFNINQGNPLICTNRLSVFQYYKQLPCRFV